MWYPYNLAASVATMGYEGDALSFRESVLQKIKIDHLARQVLTSIGSPGSGKKVNKDAMRELLEINGYAYKRERDLDLHILTDGSGKDTILVLDNELALYRTTLQDVAMRKSPTVKEMVSIRNAIKILKDTDVVVSRREETVRAVQQAGIQTLDFRYEKEDIEAMGKDGMAALDNGYADGVVEMLGLFEEILGYEPLPKPLSIPHCHMAGAPDRKTSGGVAYGPVVVYNMMVNKLRFIDDVVRVSDEGSIETLHAIARCEEDAAVEGPEVFEKLTAMFLGSATKGGGRYHPNMREGL
jgi:hypothetical protein